MIRQLRRLTRPVAAARAEALAIYAEARGNEELAVRAAAEKGFEGVACIDDSARAAVLYCAAWRRERLPWARMAAERQLRFVMFMQDGAGRFANFILDWDGRQNLTGPTSLSGGWPWTARAMHALACAVVAFPDAPEYAERFELGLPHLERPCPHLDLRAVCVLAALEYWSATGAPRVAERALAWAEEIRASRLGDVLPDAAGNPEIHLWGHLQEGALARAGRAFDRPDLVEAARAGVEAVFVPRVDRAFRAPDTLPFEVSSAVFGLDEVARATGEARYAEYADLARAWFHGRNAAGVPVYDRLRGLVHDGIDDGRVNANSGAESNVEGALALFDSLPWELYGGPAPWTAASGRGRLLVVGRPSVGPRPRRETIRA